MTATADTRSMTVLVTGSTGFLGRYVLESLEKHGLNVVAIGRRPPHGTHKTFIEADLLAAPDFDAIVKAANATHLLHLAWYTEHGRYWTSPQNLRWVTATTSLVEAFCKAGGQHVVVAGTCAEYDWSYGYCREESTPLNPATLYGAAKDATRRLVASICGQHEIPCAWGRVFIPIGAGEARDRLVPSLIEVFQGKRPPFGVNAAAYRDLMHASDVAEGLVALLCANADGPYNISSGEPTRLEDFVREIALLLDADPRCVLSLSNDRPQEPRLLVGDNGKLLDLDWTQTLTLSQSLERIAAQTLTDLPRGT